MLNFVILFILFLRFLENCIARKLPCVVVQYDSGLKNLLRDMIICVGYIENGFYS